MTTLKEVEALFDEVEQVIIALDLIMTSKHPVTSFGDSYKRIGVNFSLRACEIAADITGYDRTLCKALNHKFRSDFCKMMFERALKEVAQA